MSAVVREGGFTIKVVVEMRSPPSRSTIRSLTRYPHKAIPSPLSPSPHRSPRARHWIWLSRGRRRRIWRRSRGPPPPGPAVPRLAYRAAIGGLLLVVAAPEPLSTAATCTNPAEPPPTTATSQ